MEDFPNDYIPVFDLTSLQGVAEQLHYPELSGESLRLEMLFQFPLEQVTVVIVLGESLSNIKIEKLKKQSLKMFDFFEFPGSYKNIVFFWDFSLFYLYTIYFVFLQS